MNQGVWIGSVYAKRIGIEIDIFICSKSLTIFCCVFLLFFCHSPRIKKKEKQKHCYICSCVAIFFFCVILLLVLMMLKEKQKQKNNRNNYAFLGSHANGILNNLLNHLNGNNHQTSNYARPYYDDASSTTAKLEYELRETEQLLEISLLKKKLRETERAMEQIIADIHGKAAKCNNDDENNASNINATMDVTTTQVRSSNFSIFKQTVVTNKANQNQKQFITQSHETN